MHNVVENSTRFLSYMEPIYKEPTCRRPKYLKNYTTKNDILKELFDLKYFYNCKHQELKKIGIQVK